MEIVIIGAGAMGGLFAALLAPHARVCLHTTNSDHAAAINQNQRALIAKAAQIDRGGAGTAIIGGAGQAGGKRAHVPVALEGRGQRGGEEGDRGAAPAPGHPADPGAEREHIGAGREAGEAEAEVELLAGDPVAALLQFLLQHADRSAAASEREIAVTSENGGERGEAGPGDRSGLWRHQAYRKPCGQAGDFGASGSPWQKWGESRCERHGAKCEARRCIRCGTSHKRRNEAGGPVPPQPAAEHQKRAPVQVLGDLSSKLGARLVSLLPRAASCGEAGRRPL